jgi:hypothetical protein
VRARDTPRSRSLRSCTCWIPLRAGRVSTGKQMNEGAASLVKIMGGCESYCAERTYHSLFFIQIFLGNIILWHLMRANFPFISAPGVFHARHYVSFKRVSLFEQLVDTLRIRTLDAG